MATRFLVQDTLELLDRTEFDWTRVLAAAVGRDGCAHATAGSASLRALFDEPAELEAWLARYRARLASEPVAAAERATRMNRVNRSSCCATIWPSMQSASPRR